MVKAILALALAIGGSGAAAQGPGVAGLDQVRTMLAETGRAELKASGLLIERADFERGTAKVEAIVVRPAQSEGKKPALFLVPGHSRTAFDMLPQAVRFAKAGFAVMAASQPGYGGSTGPADFAGPATFAALKDAAERFAAQPFVDRERMGVYGYSRGALAAAELAARTDLFKASVLGGGIYDFKAAYDQVTLDGIRENMKTESGLDAEAIRFRSPIEDMSGLDGPVLIVHGAADVNAPPAQAEALAARLEALHKPHELILVPDKDHGLAMADIITPAIAFFTRYLVD